jgi:D-alanine-D-alanine ligase
MKKKSILLFGGTSEERLVSVASAQNLASQWQFDELYFQDKKEAVFRVSLNELQSHQNVFKAEFKPDESKRLGSNLKDILPSLKDSLVFLGYHGTQGENGEVQSLFESNKIYFTGSGAKSSHEAFEKDKAKDIMSNTGCLMPDEIVFTVNEITEIKDALELFLKKHKKIVFKPTSSGSSFGLHLVSTVSQLEFALGEIKKSPFQQYLVENFIQGRELTVGIVQMHDELIALPASEVILLEGRSFDYEGKYLGSGTKEVTPAELNPNQVQMAQQLAIEAHLAFGCYGYSRTDMILSDEGAYFLETNTLPGLSKPSFIPQQLQAADITFTQFIESQLELAEHRYDID